jgi:hypothetical protein
MLAARNASWEAVAPGGLDQHGAGAHVAGLGDGAETTTLARGMFGWHQAKIGHEVACIDEAGWITHCSNGSGCCDDIETPQRTQPLHQGEK